MGYAMEWIKAALLAAAILIPLPSRSRAKVIEQMGQSHSGMIRAAMGVDPICDSVFLGYHCGLRPNHSGRYHSNGDRMWTDEDATWAAGFYTMGD